MDDKITIKVFYNTKYQQDADSFIFQYLLPQYKSYRLIKHQISKNRYYFLFQDVHNIKTEIICDHASVRNMLGAYANQFYIQDIVYNNLKDKSFLTNYKIFNESGVINNGL